jgi:hypothetical protein
LPNPIFFVANCEERLAKMHPLRAIKRHADEVLKRSFDAAYVVAITQKWLRIGVVVNDFEEPERWLFGELKQKGLETPSHRFLDPDNKLQR